MICCAEARLELVAIDRGETSPDVAAAVAAHVKSCAACAAEREALRRTTAVVAEHLEIDLSPDARLRLSEVLTAEMARRRPRAGRLLLFALPVAAAAAVLVLWFAWPQHVAGPGDAVGTATESAVASQTTSQSNLTPQTAGAVERALSWLSARSRKDGTWAPSDDADDETRAAVTAAALLAYAADGRTPRGGARAELVHRAADRLSALLDAGFSSDADRKPLYAQALGVRALAAIYVADRAEMSPTARRAARDRLARAGRTLVSWQGDDGGFGYVPHSPRSDSACTVFAAAALADLRDADVLDAAGALSRTGHYLESLRGGDGAVGYQRPGDRRESPVVTAAAMGLDSELRLSPPPPEAVATVTRALAAGGDALLAWTGVEALARHDLPVDAPVHSLLSSQRPDGSWAALADRRCAAGGDDVTTAFGVLALTASGR